MLRHFWAGTQFFLATTLFMMQYALENGGSNHNIALPCNVKALLYTHLMEGNLCHFEGKFIIKIYISVFFLQKFLKICKKWWIFLLVYSYEILHFFPSLDHDIPLSSKYTLLSLLVSSTDFFFSLIWFNLCNMFCILASTWSSCMGSRRLVWACNCSTASCKRSKVIQIRMGYINQGYV